MQVNLHIPPPNMDRLIAKALEMENTHHQLPELNRVIREITGLKIDPLHGYSDLKALLEQPEQMLILPNPDGSLAQKENDGHIERRPSPKANNATVIMAKPVTMPHLYQLEIARLQTSTGLDAPSPPPKSLR